MKFYTTARYGLATLVAAGFLGLLGCASTSNQGSERVTSMMEAVDTDISQVAEQLEAVSTSLQELFRADQSSIEEAFKTYTSNVSSLQRSGNRLIEDVENLNERSNEYFARWQEQERDFSNQEIRRVSEQRRSEVNAIYEDLERSNQGLDEAIVAFMNDSRELQEYLSNDLTPKGLEAISSLVPDLTDNSESIQRNLSQMQSAIQRVGTELAQGGMQQ